MKPRPLSGLRVIDLSRVVAAPTCTQILGDLGAEVIKIERPGEGDESRRYGVQVVRDASGRTGSEGAMHISVNRNKKGIALDIAKPAGQEIVRRLAAKSDALVENFKTGDLARYGLDHDAIKATNPRIVYCSVTGYGQTGPYRAKPGYDSVFQARGGWMSVNGTAEEPMMVAANMADTITGYFAAMSVLAALYHRDRSDDPGGQGQAIDIGMLDVALASMAVRAQDWLLSGTQPPRRDNAGSVFPCADGSIVAAIAIDSRWQRFCELIGAPEIGRDPRYAGYADRQKHPDGFDKAGEYSRKHKSSELVAALEVAGVPVAPIYDFAQAFADPQAQARGLTRRARHASGAELDLVANPMRFSATPLETYEAPPVLGQHTEEVLSGLLGLGPGELAELRRDGVI